MSLEHQNPSKTSEKWVILIALQFRYTFHIIQQTKRLRARKIGLQYRIRTRLLIFKMTKNKVDLGQISNSFIHTKLLWTLRHV